MKKFLRDLLLPHIGNNFRSRLLHHSSVFVVILLVLSSGFLLSQVRTTFPQVLGVSYDITSSQLLYLTNLKRQENGTLPLSINEKLSVAAAQKAKNMFSENYWAHNSPDGKTPWVFIKSSNYSYVYAGENLARGFETSNDVIKAWMASPDHRDNMLSKNYTDVGFAVEKGKLLGEDTVLIVEMLGSTTLAAQKGSETATLLPASSQNENLVLSKNEGQPLINSIALSKNLALSVVILFMAILVIDMLIIEKRKITRFIGHNVDHILYFAVVLLTIIIVARGFIL